MIVSKLIYFPLSPVNQFFFFFYFFFVSFPWIFKFPLKSDALLAST